MTDLVTDTVLGNEAMDVKCEQLEGDGPAGAGGANEVDVLEASSANEAPNASENQTLVTADGGVTKTILREGTGDLPPLHARCLGESKPGHGTPVTNATCCT
jgi:hypothetical protein